MLAYLCKNHRWLMWPVLFVLLFSGIWVLIALIAVLFENRDNFSAAMCEIWAYLFRSKENIKDD